ncbi:MAG: glycosyltransferase family 2 protein [Acidobacteriota bacterium]|nr:glycosyltransferase family 2 protein [Acidobacteriota bacterium]
MASPFVSIIVPFFNAEKYIQTCIRSLLQQTHSDLEVLAIDDGSTDDSAKLLGEFADDQRLHILSRKNSGGPAAPRNSGLGKARGKYILFFDADDIADPSKVKRTVDCLENDLDMRGLVATDFSAIDENGYDVSSPGYLSKFDRIAALLRANQATGIVSMGPQESYELLLLGNFIGTSSVAVRRAVLVEVGRFDETLKNGDDYEFWLRLVRHSGMMLIGESLHKYRLVGSSISKRPAIQLAPNRIEVLKRQLEFARPGTQSIGVKRKIARNYNSMAWELKEAGDYVASKNYYRLAMRWSISVVSIRGLIMVSLRAIYGRLTRG